MEGNMDMHMRRSISLSAGLKIISLLLCLFLGGCANNDSMQQRVINRYVRDDLGLNVSDGRVIDFYDSHEVFKKNGTTSIAIKYSDGQMAEALAQREDWQPFPLDRDTHILVYGGVEASSFYMPIISRDNYIGPLVPDIKNGFYILVDRQSSDKERSILDRSTFNLTVGLYDTDANVLYVLAYDT